MNSSTPILSIILWTQFVGAAVAAPTVKVTARDASGAEISDFEAMLAVGSQRHTHWHKSENGNAEFSAFDLLTRRAPDSYVGSAEVFVRAPGYATASKVVTLTSGRQHVQIELHKGRVLTVNFRDESGRAIPADLHPLLFPASYRDTGGYRWQRVEDHPQREPEDDNWYLLKRRMPGSYGMRVTDQMTELYVSIDDHDFLRCFESGPIDVASSEDPIVIHLPTPASLRAIFTVPMAAGEPPIESIDFTLSRPKTKTSKSHFIILTNEPQASDAEFSISNLAPGPVLIGVTTTTRNEVEYYEADPGRFCDGVTHVLKPGELKQVDFQYKPFSERPFLGDKDVLVRVVDRTGNPVNSKRFAVSYADRHFGEFVVAQGTIGDGQIRLTDLSPTSGVEHPQRYSLSVNDRTVGWFEVEAASSGLQTLLFQLAPDVGDSAISVTAADLDTGKPVELEFRDRITLLEFWASWCGPCQEPMQKLDQLAENKADEWKARVQLVAISIDESVETARRHVRANDWLSARNLIDLPAATAKANAVGFASTTASDYLISGVPTALLIDQRGKIVFRGHPNSLDLVTEVEKLLRRE